MRDIPNGKNGVRATLDYMARYIKEGKTNINVRVTALKLCEHLPPKDWIGEIKAIHQFVLHNIRYIHDVDGVETLAQPNITLKLKQGDCDDKVILAGALLQTIGHPIKLVAVGFNGQPLSHVYIETRVGNRWFPMELTYDLPTGQAPPGVTSRLERHVKSNGR